MLSILAKSFMVATQTDERDTPQNRKRRPEDYWWKKYTRVTRSCAN